jgi:EAL domain-containing protein (putative c-di-GMP-specific phosphodiesterase class I)
MLATLHCDLAQGYFIARPLDAAGMTDWLTAIGPIPALGQVAATN